MPFDSQPTLTGTLVELRPLRESDHGALHAVAADRLIWEQHPARNRHEQAGFRAFFAESLASRGALLATDVEIGEVIGSSRFHGYSEERSEVEIGWTFLARSHWGGKYNAELKQLMLRHAFRFVDSVVFLVDAENIRSRRAVEKIGVALEPERDAGGRLLYRITASAFAGLGAEQQRIESPIEIRIDDLNGPEVIGLLQEHLRSVALHSPPESVHALDLESLRQPEVTFWSLWQEKELLGCGAMREIGARHGEIKSMRTASRHQRKGVAARLMRHIIAEAERRSYERLSLETGSMEVFAPARNLYSRFGFRPCGPFGDYIEDPNSVFMTREL